MASDGQQPISMAEEARDWGSNATFGVLAGMLYGGSKETFGTTHLAKVLPPMQAGKDLKTQRFMWREMLEQRVIKITRGTILGGAKLGSFTAIFCGVQSWLAVERNVHDTLNVAAAGSVTAASFGLALPGSFLTRMRAAAIGSVLGATVCLPLGYLQTTLEKQAKVTMDRPTSGNEETDGINAVILRLERNLAESEKIERPERQKE